MASVLVTPGATAFTVIPRRPSWLASVKLMASTADLVITNDVWVGLAMRVATEETVTMRPPSRRRDSACWTMK